MNIGAARCPQCGGTDQAYFPEDGDVCWNCWKNNQEEGAE